ncbi:MAG: thioredoxin fold domain-containing protein [Gammaproteobacteria bacterium]|nr:thioredoxin fold domain-containing protein [Gammaproteobacteria bacterium]
MFPRSCLCSVLLLLALSIPFELYSGQQLFSADGYRMARYRAPLPDAPPAGQRISTGELAELIAREKPLLIDVQAVTVRPETKEFGISWLPGKERWHIPGSIWLPNVGYGRLEPGMLAYLQGNLQRLTRGDPSVPLVFYCVVDCWMSWNTVKRAEGLGYRNLYWYPEGSDGWSAAGMALARGQPVPIPDRGLTDSCLTDDEQSFFDSLDGDLSRALVRVQSDSGPNGVMLFFETTECPFCKRMRQGVLSRPELICYFRERFVSVALNLESDMPLTAPDGSQTTQKEYSRRVHRVVRTPTMIFLGTDGAEVYRHTGIIVDHRKLRALADYIGGGFYAHIGFKEFLLQ